VLRSSALGRAEPVKERGRVRTSQTQCSGRAHQQLHDRGRQNGFGGVPRQYSVQKRISEVVRKHREKDKKLPRQIRTSRQRAAEDFGKQLAFEYPGLLKAV
jgi:hypothetical protein